MVNIIKSHYKDGAVVLTEEEKVGLLGLLKDYEPNPRGNLTPIPTAAKAVKNGIITPEKAGVAEKFLNFEAEEKASKRTALAEEATKHWVKNEINRREQVTEASQKR